MMLSDLGRLGLSLWLIRLAVIDVRRRQLPHSLTTVPLLGLGGLAVLGSLLSLNGLTVTGQSWDDAALALALVAVMLSDTPLGILPGFAALGVAVVLGTPVGQTIVIAWLLVLLLSVAGILGAGDAKVVMILLAVCPDARLGLTLLATCAGVGLILMVWQLRAATPLWLVTLARDALQFRFPARTGEVGRLNLPLIPLLTAGALLYLWGLT
jgi:hypothetical protein